MANAKESLIHSLKNHGFSKEIISAFENVKREDFLQPSFHDRAYSDIALPIGQGQTISQPYTIATMLSLLDLKQEQKVLEAGSGSGYTLALISEIIGKNGKVYGTERIEELAEQSKIQLHPYKNAEVIQGDANFGSEKNAPFDRIIISAACEKVPEVLVSQLKEGGILVAPLGIYGESQDLVAIRKHKGSYFIEKKVPGFAFVRFV
ncbi:protein-L-isoaspartate O-methyltransferase [Candidatus Pacearchaeota archaeon]|nr:protein-L-isoaspartate O-methyltransferase [Candidatus Pacearchaeota archaeon]